MRRLWGVCIHLPFRRDSKKGGGIDMVSSGLSSDPYNVIITGVGGQGNVMASRVLGNMLSLKGLFVTIGETFGASQRGGSVMSHLRISAASSFSPQIPKGKAHMVVSLEPTEAIRVLKDYGNSQTMALCNTRPIHPVGAAARGPPRGIGGAHGRALV